jgi:hypothetical protein
MRLKVTALIVGALLWALAKGEQEGSNLVSVPLVLRNMPEGLTTVEHLPATADVLFEGDNKELVRLSLWGEPYALVDMTGAEADQTFRVSLSAANVVVPGEGEVQVVEVRTPRNLDLAVDELVNRRVAVAPVVEGVPAEGYYVFGTWHTLPDSVFVFGPERIVSGLRSVSTAPLSIEGRRSRVDASRSIEFDEDWNLHAVPKEVRVLVDIEGTRVATVPDVPMVFEHEPGFEEATVVPEVVELTISGPEHLTMSVDAENVEVLVDAMGLPRGTHELVPDVSVPEGIEVTAVTPARVTVTLK